MIITVKAKAIVIGGQITLTNVCPSGEVYDGTDQLDIFPIEMPDKTIAEQGDFDQEEFNKGQSIKEVTISWEE